MDLEQTFISRLLWHWGAPLFQATVAFAMLPVITAILGPADIGVFALVTAIAGLVAAVSGMGSTYILSAHYPTLDGPGRRGLVSTVLALAVTVALLASVVVMALWHPLSARWQAVAGVPSSWIALALATSVAGVPWTIATDTLMLRGGARRFALIGVTQSAVGAGVTTVCLYTFDLGLTALFVSALAVSAVAGVAGLIFLRDELALRIERRWLIECLRVGPIMGGGHLLETVHTVVERVLLSSTVGLAALGLYAHSQQYRNMVQIGVKGIARSVWPVSLEEARTPQNRFDLTNRAWRAAALAITAGGLIASFLARDIIALLTHDKFTAAAPFVALWMAYVLVQNMGKPQAAVLFSAQKGTALGWIGQGTRAFGIVLLFVLVPVAGLAGAFIALFAQQIAIRVAFHLCARRVAATPFQDGWFIAGCAVIATAYVAATTVDLALPARAALCAGFLCAFALSGHTVLRDMFAFARSRVAINQ